MDPNAWILFYQSLGLFFYFGIGACVGSFLNVCSFRIPEGLSIVRPPSRCPQCGHGLSWHENIPILSFLFLRGRCRSCRNPISLQYPLVEIVTGLLFALSAHQFQTEPVRLAGFLVLVGFCVLLSSIDARTMLLPNAIVFPMMAAATLYAPWNPWLGSRWDARLVDMLTGFFTGAGILFIFGWLGTWILGKDALGGGDIKLLGALGMVLGWQGVLDGLFLGSLISGLWGGGLMLGGRLKSKTPLPYGPFLCMGCVLTALWPNTGLSFWLSFR